MNAPRQHDIEAFLNDHFKHGDKEALAAILDVSPSLISQEFNPEVPEKKSKFYQCVRQIWGAYQIRPDLGDLLVQKIICLSRLWHGKKAEKDISHLIGLVTSEFSDTVVAELEKKPMQVRLLEAMQLQVAVNNYVSGLMFEDVEDGVDEFESRKVTK